MAVYRVRNWARFQHYKHRNPPWIKLHFELLSSPDWVVLADASRVLAIACMLIASRNEGKVSGDRAGIEYLKRVAYLHKDPDFKPLIECGFLEVASTMLADASALQANPLSESESETEFLGAASPATEIKSSRPKRSNGASKSSTIVPDDFVPDLAYASNLAADMDVAIEVEKFRLWEFRKPHHDWNRAWKRWVREGIDRGKYARKSQPKPQQRDWTGVTQDGLPPVFR